MAVNDVTFYDPAPVDRLDHRAQRRGQDDVLQHAHRPLQADARAGSRSTAATSRARARTGSPSAGIARTFQNIRLFATMTALENVMVGQHARMKAGLFGSILRTPGVRREEREVAREGARDARVRRPRAGAVDQLAINLSYGDQRRVEIARALASDPKLLLLDEPTAGMNPQESARLTDFMRRLRDERGLTILLIEHDMKVVMGVSERITVLDHGEKIAEGDPQEVRAEPARHRGLPRQAEAGSSTDGAARGRRHPHLLRQHRGAQGHLARGQGGRDRHADRLQRRRQVDDAALDLRAHAAAHGLDPLRRRATSRRCRRRRSCGSASRSRPRAATASRA